MVWEQQILRPLSLLPLRVLSGGASVSFAQSNGEKTLSPFSKISKCTTHSLTRARRMLQNNTFVFLLRFFLGLALAAGGLSRAGRGSGSCCRPSASCCCARCTTAVCLDPLGGLLLSLLHRPQDRGAFTHRRVAEL